MKTITTLFFVLLFSTLGFSQGNLQYNLAKIVNDQIETVPANKVWKITAVYGKEEVCRQVVPLYGSNWWSKALVVGFFINNVEILSFRKFLSQTMYNNSNTCAVNGQGTYDFSALNFDSDPNILPIWVPAGATVKSVGPNVFLSVVEFNIIP